MIAGAKSVVFEHCTVLVIRADFLQSDSECRKSKTGKPLVRLRIAFDQVNLIKGDTL